MDAVRNRLLGPAACVAGVLACFAAYGCFRKLEETVSGDAGALIVFEGSGGPVTIAIDGAVVADGAYLVPSDGVRYRVPKGRHEVEVRSGERLLVRRDVYVADGETREIRVPKP
ncbi:MAG: hypothetical protein ACUVYA_02160 [Planctomycetota bacterium]